MKVYKGLEQYEGIENPIITTGTFDGVHLAHQKIISRIKEIARDANGESMLITYSPHPRLVLGSNEKELKLINTLDEKIHLLEKFGLDHVLVINFTREFSEISSEKYIQEILVEKIGVKKLVIGYNHHFGKNREGSITSLNEYGKSYGFEVEEIPEQDIDDMALSSTRIRESLSSGDIKTANSFLGYDYYISGEVVKGTQLGRSIGFATANIDIKDVHKLIPTDGVYAVEVSYKGDCLKGMLNIGVRPTINGKDKTIEVNIFDFEEDIYGESIEIYFKDRIRKEKKFDDLDSLKGQLVHDKQKALEILS